MARRLKKRDSAPDGAREAKVTTGKDDDLSCVRGQFQDSQDTSIAERAEAEDARRYFDNLQWTEAERKALAGRGQPVVTDNKVKDKLLYLFGMERKTRTDPKAYPRTAQDEEAADAATDGLRFVTDQNLWNYVRSDTAENVFIEGRGGVEIVIDKTKMIVDKTSGSRRPRIMLRHIRPDRLYVDAYSMRADYKDATYMGIVTWMDFDQAKQRWPGKIDILDTTMSEGPTDRTFDDKPRWIINTTRRKRVQVFQHYYLKKDKWWYCEFVWGGFLLSPEESAYNDYSDSKDGIPSCPIEVQALYREGETGRAYGEVRRLKDMQDEWNKRRSKALHLLNVNQVIMEDGAAGSDEGDTAAAIEKVRKEAARPDGVIMTLPGMKLELVKNTDLSAGNLQMMQLTGAALAATGPNEALAGQTGHVSGRAKELDQQGGLVAIDKPFDAIKYLSLRIYRQIWNRITQFWTEETWIRVRDEDQLEFIAFNRRTTPAELIAEKLKTADMPDEEKMGILQRLAMNQIYNQPMIHNNVAEMDIDINIDDSPDVLTLQQETFATLAELVKAGLQIPPRAIIEASPLRSSIKRKITDAMSGANDPAQAAMAKMQQQQMELQMQMLQLKNMLLEAQVQKTNSDTGKNVATSHETDVDSTIKMATYLLPAPIEGEAGKPGAKAAPASKTSVSVN